MHICMCFDMSGQLAMVGEEVKWYEDDDEYIILLPSDNDDRLNSLDKVTFWIISIYLILFKWQQNYPQFYLRLLRLGHCFQKQVYTYQN